MFLRILGLVLSLIALAMSCYSYIQWTRTRKKLLDENHRLRCENYKLTLKLAEYEVGNE